MNDITQRTLLERRIQIGSDSANVTREGNRIKITYGWAGRLTREEDTFYVDDIRRLAQFVEDTETPPADAQVDQLLRHEGVRMETRRHALNRHARKHFVIIGLLIVIAIALNFWLPVS